MMASELDFHFKHTLDAAGNFFEPFPKKRSPFKCNYYEQRAGGEWSIWRQLEQEEVEELEVVQRWFLSSASHRTALISPKPIYAADTNYRNL